MSKKIRLAAVTASLDWKYRQTCSQEHFDLAVASAYIEAHVQHMLALMRRAAEDGADLVLGPEYFRGSELFNTTDCQRQMLAEPVGGETVQRLQSLSKEHGVYLAAAFNVAHEGFIAQTGVITGRQGELVGTHIKHNSLPKDRGLEKGQELYALDIGNTGILICSDLTEDPRVPLLMARSGMNLLLVPGCGFAGKLWKEFLVVRAYDTGCVLVYADEKQAAIIGRKGETLAETREPDAIIQADVEIG